MKVTHSSQPAAALEFYIPAAVWNHPATREFLDALYTLDEGATVLGGAKGVWKGEVESTNLVRILIRTSELNLEQVLREIRKRIGALMTAWCSPGGECQHTVMFTVSQLTVHESQLSGTHTTDDTKQL